MAKGGIEERGYLFQQRPERVRPCFLVARDRFKSREHGKAPLRARRRAARPIDEQVE